MFRQLIGEDVDIVLCLDPLLRQIKADDGQMEQVILNLLLNSRDAMPQGGKVMLETQNIHLDESYARRHIDLHPGAYTVLSVTDTGCGMDEETQKHLFE